MCIKHRNRSQLKLSWTTVSSPAGIIQYTRTHTVIHVELFTHTHTSIPCDHARRYAKGQSCHLPEITKTQRGRERQRKPFNLTNYQTSSTSLTVNHTLRVGATFRSYRGFNTSIKTHVLFFFRSLHLLHPIFPLWKVHRNTIKHQQFSVNSMWTLFTQHYVITHTFHSSIWPNRLIEGL